MNPDKAKSLANDILCAVATLRAVADELLTCFPDSDYDEPEEKIPFETEPMPTPKAPEVTLSAVQKLLSQKVNEGLGNEVRALIKKYGSSKISEVDPAKLPSLYKEAEGLK